MTPEQDEAIQDWRSGQNLFITGQGGTGKSQVIKYIWEHDPTVHVTAMTGCAALLLGCGAKTLHSWAGLGIASELPHVSALSRWRKTKTLIVDEVSMMSADLFEKLDRIGRRLRKSNKLFGGIQLILSGDFFQLPPVEGLFCFKSPLWSFKTIVFTTNFRQSDPLYQEMLTQIRQGKLSKASVRALKGRVIAGDGFTRLVPTRSKADKINQTEYSKLEGPEYDFPLQRVCPEGLKGMYTSDLDSLVKHARLDHLKLKVGTRVMCTVNLTPTICNGSQGVVERFDGGMPVIKFSTGTMTMTPHLWPVEDQRTIGVAQLPLMHAWAITIHKSQGATLDTAVIDIGKDMFEAGQAYVALSRVKAFSGLYVSELDFSRFLLDTDVVAFYAQFEKPI